MRTAVKSSGYTTWTSADSGTYTCTASNDGNNAVSQEFSLTVECKPIALDLKSVPHGRTTLLAKSFYIAAL